MQVASQNSYVDSMERALAGAPGLIDSRTEKDWLCFLADFASLINFYDNNNTIRGNWTPFLTKDPVFLLAAISKTHFDQSYSAYTGLCTRMEELLKPGGPSNVFSQGFNQLFDQLTSIFMCIKRWIYYMKVSVYEYPLKTYVIQQVKSTFSRYFWALISLRQNLFLSEAITDIGPVDHSQLIFFGSHDEMIWKQNKDKSPYWEILDLSYPVKSEKNTASRFYEAVKKVGDELFVFFNTIITQATTEYELLKKRKSKYPDTLLLRTFVDLLKVHQDQLNGLTQKHLQFYYKDILKQQEFPAIADRVFVCAELAKKNAVVNLPAGTVFDAGVDSEGKPVVFASRESMDLNPGTITGAYTLAAVKDPIDKRSRLYQQTIIGVDTVHKDEDGKTVTWAPFGNGNDHGALKLRPAIAFASPLLLLREGSRSITFTLKFKNPIDQQQLFQDATFYFSTLNDWLPVEPEPANPGQSTANKNQAVFLFELLTGKPAIETFLKHPDGISSPWPMFKIELGSVGDFSLPEELSALQIEVNVTGVKTFQLYNDYGMVSAQAPFPLFGPAPLLDSYFIIGSSEIFSKPVKTLNIKLEWDKLPEFFPYYKQYNEYIRWQQNLQDQEKKSWFKKTFEWLIKPICQAWNWIKSLFKRKKELVFKNQYNNTCFKVNFQLLQDGSWKYFPMWMKMPVVIGNDLHPINQPTPVESKTGVDIQPANLLFRTEGKDCHLSSWSCFAYEEDKDQPFVCDPTLQLVPLQFTRESVSGFMKMILAGTDFGFGSGIYPNVVSYIALKNAQEMTKMAADEDYKPKFTEPANLPFVPKLTNLTGHYTASQQYFFTAGQNDHPIQCFLYTPFSNYKVYDNITAPDDYAYTLDGPDVQSATIPLFHPFTYGGYLFLQMENVVAPGVIHLYFELTRKWGVSTGEKKDTGFFYLGKKGWTKLPVLSDGTDQFSDTGIIKLKIPADIDRESSTMPGDQKCWIAIAVKGDPASFANTVFLKTNGIETIRTGNSFLNSNITPRLTAGAIKKILTPMPSVTGIVQPFPSFGGKAAEKEAVFNHRVGTRIKTKDRVVAKGDYYRLIRQEFNDVYYSKTIFDTVKRSTTVYVVKAVQDATEAGAFIPLVTYRKEKGIQYFLAQRAPVFCNIRVSNFDLQVVQVYAEVSGNPGFQHAALQTAIVDTLNFFLSPWIAGNGTQATIDTSISDEQVAAVIRSIEGVKEVRNVSFITSPHNGYDLELPPGLTRTPTVKPLGENYLMISGMKHTIQFVPKKND